MSDTRVTFEATADGGFKNGRVIRRHPANEEEGVQAEDSHQKQEEPASVKYSPYRREIGRI